MAPWSKVPGCLRALWSDNFDLGFVIRSEKTGVKIPFVLFEREIDDEGRYLSWTFAPKTNDSSLKDIRAIVENDMYNT
jgi:hypothetical protein